MGQIEYSNSDERNAHLFNSSTCLKFRLDTFLWSLYYTLSSAKLSKL